MRFFLRKNQRLNSEKDISNLFLSGKTLYVYPLKLVFLLKEENTKEVKVLFSVPKKYFKKAIWRNTIRRRIKEAYRINSYFRSPVNTELQMAFIYISKEIIDYKEIEVAVKELLTQLKNILDTKIDLNNSNI